MAEEKPLQRIRDGIAKSQGSTQAEKEANYFEAISEEAKKSIPGYGPDDKRIAEYTYPSHLPRPVDLQNAIYSIQGENPSLSLLKIALSMAQYEIRLLNLEIEALKTKKPVDQKAIARCVIQRQLNFKSIGSMSLHDHFWLAKDYYDQFCAHPNLKSYIRCMRHLNDTRSKKNVLCREAVVKMREGLMSASDAVKDFHGLINQMRPNTPYLITALKEMESRISESTENGQTADWEAWHYSPGSFVEWAFAREHEGGAECHLWEVPFKQKANSLEARWLWNKLMAAHNGLEKTRENLKKTEISDQEKQTLLSDQEKFLMDACKYFGLLIEVTSAISFKKYLDPQILSFLSGVTPEAKRCGYVAYKWADDLDAAILMDSVSSSDVSYPRSSNGKEFDEFRNSILSEGLQLCRSLPERSHPKVQELAKRIEESLKLSGIQFLDLHISESILATAALFEEVLEIVEDQSYEKLKAFESQCKKLREEVISIRNTVLIKEGKNSKQIVKNELKNVGVAWGSVRWMSHKNWLNIAVERDEETTHPKEAKTGVMTVAPLSIKTQAQGSISSSTVSSLEATSTTTSTPQVTVHVKPVPTSSSSSASSKTTKQPLTRLGQLIHSGNLEEIKKTLTTEELNQPVDGINPPLVYAVIHLSTHKKHHMVEYLLTRGADPNAKGQKGRTALEWANENLSKAKSLELMRLRVAIDALEEAVEQREAKAEAVGVSVTSASVGTERPAVQLSAPPKSAQFIGSQRREGVLEVNTVPVVAEQGSGLSS